MSGESTNRVQRRRLSAEGRRELILESGIREFGEYGYEKASVRAIARGAGVTTPVIYDHFSSKRELYIAIIEQEEANLREYQQRERRVSWHIRLLMIFFVGCKSTRKPGA
jgi:AcrR family transcriptional regulator